MPVWSLTALSKARKAYRKIEGQRCSVDQRISKEAWTLTENLSIVHNEVVKICEMIDKLFDEGYTTKIK